MAKLIGLTGGIGSGKTTIAKFFAEKGISIYIADHEAKQLMESKTVQEKVKSVFGQEVFTNGRLDRPKLAAIVFNDPEKLKKLNEIVHPVVRTHFKNWVNEHQNEELLIYESAILFESGHYKDFDCIITVTAPLESRIARVLKRDETNRAEIERRINAQWTDSERIVKSDFEIENMDLKEARDKVSDILKILKIKQKE
ncbi:dephospho-CoA kinase [Flavobacterium sp.]|uniref:dephospho-CoA kinase n=1 Tax=Flavobacterium sp. TaxID=239 RepID=UPI00263339B0|nr:dephospho-CoA kinase [Flavobacterium sp.]MDG2431821.1 dephospho-CoA kinase [Flavobacterium sp.]